MDTYHLHIKKQVSFFSSLSFSFLTMSQLACGDQRENEGYWFSPPCGFGESNSNGLMASIFSNCATLLA